MNKLKKVFDNMKLLFDLKATQPMAKNKRHGGGKYAEVIFYRMVKRGIKFSCFYDSTKWLNPQIEEMCSTFQIPLYDLNRMSLTEIVQVADITRLYSALPSTLASQLILLNGCEIIGTIHGLRDFETPADKIFYSYNCSYREIARFLFKKFMPKVFLGRRRKQFKKLYIDSKVNIVTVSMHSKFSILSYFPQLKDLKIPVFYSPNTSTRESIRKYSQNEKYFMAVSGNRWQKNNLRAVMAFDKLVSNGYFKDMRMKITGTLRTSFKYKIQNIDRFDFMEYVDDKQLEELYAAAYAFVYPSLNEGFGYPPLEAMKYGVPVIASPLSSITEVCGDAALYFNPFSVEEIMNRMLMIIQPELHDEYSRRSFTRYGIVKKKQEKDLDLLIDYITQ